MSLLRIRCPLSEPPVRCEWALIERGREPLYGHGKLAELPRRASRIQLVIPAAQVLLTRTRLPRAARRKSGAVLAYAVEDQTLREPEANQVVLLGPAGDSDALAIVDRAALANWNDALVAAGVASFEIHVETLLLPWSTQDWSLAWDGREGFVRTGEFDGAATDCGERTVPPLSLHLTLDEARARDAGPQAITVYPTVPDAAPDVQAWQRSLGVALRLAGPWDWRNATADRGVGLLRHRRRWRTFPGFMARLRPAAWAVGAALLVHAVASVADWALLAHEQRALRLQMESRFRATFPDTVAVVDPALQMRRKLAEARRARGMSDQGDFLPMIEQVAAALNSLPEGSLRTVSYENARVTLEITQGSETKLRPAISRLQQAGLSVEAPVASAGSPGGGIVLTVRAP